MYVCVNGACRCAVDSPACAVRLKPWPVAAPITPPEPRSTSVYQDVLISEATPRRVGIASAVLCDMYV